MYSDYKNTELAKQLFHLYINSLHRNDKVFYHNTKMRHNRYDYASLKLYCRLII